MIRKLMIILAITLVIPTVYATTDSKIKPVLRYAEDVDMYQKSLSNQYLEVVIEKYSFPRSSQKAKFEQALDILEEVLNSEEFRRKVISFEREIDGEKTRSYRKNYLWKDPSLRLTNEEIYNIIMQGNEYMRPDTLGQMNINAYVKKCRGVMKWVHKWCRAVIGSTAPKSSARMKLNWKFYKQYSTPEMVSNIVHEWLHLLGFLHGKTKIREEVPYVVGGIAKEVAERLLKERSNQLF